MHTTQQGKPQCLPQLAWHHVVIEHREKSTKSGKVFTVNPVRHPAMTLSFFTEYNLYAYIVCVHCACIHVQVLAVARGNKIHYIQVQLHVHSVDKTPAVLRKFCLTFSTIAARESQAFDS